MGLQTPAPKDAFHPGYRSGQMYYSIFAGSNAGGQTLSANSLYAVLFYVPRVQVFNRIGIQITTAAAAGTSLRLGIYSMSEAHPGSLILDAGTVAADTTGEKEITINQSLNPGFYYCVCLGDGGPNVRNTNFNALPLLYTPNSAGTTVSHWTASQAFGALPNPFPTPSPLYSFFPKLWLRAV